MRPDSARDIDINDVYADTHLVWPARSDVQVVAGADFLFGNGEGRGATFNYTAPLSGIAATPVSPSRSALNLDAENRRAFSGGYGQVEWTPASRLRVSAGVRLNATSERRGESGGTTHVRPSGSVGRHARPVGTRHRSRHGCSRNYRDTFKPAAFDFSLAENEGILEPETARSYEGGLKLRAAGGRVDVEASAFRMNFQNLVTATVVGGLPSLQNTGATRFQGFEAAADARAIRNVTARATYSFHDGRFTDFIQDFDGTNTQLAGRRFEMSARHLFSAGLIVAPDTGVVGSVIVKHTGDRYLNKRNTALAVPFTTLDVGRGLPPGRMGSESRRPEPDRQARRRVGERARRGAVLPDALTTDRPHGRPPVLTVSAARFRLNGGHGLGCIERHEHLVSAPCLGGIQGHVRGAKEQFARLHVGQPVERLRPGPRTARDADADRQRAAGKALARQHRCALTNSGAECLGDRAHVSIAATREADDELVAAVSAGDRIGGQPRGRELARRGALPGHRSGARTCRSATSADRGRTPASIPMRLLSRAAWIIATRRLSNERRLCRPVRSSVIASTCSRRALSVSLAVTTPTAMNSAIWTRSVSRYANVSRAEFAR